MKARLLKSTAIAVGIIGMSSGMLWATTWNVPGNFSTLKLACSSPNVVSGDVINIVSDLTEAESVMLEKSGITIEGNSKMFTFTSTYPSAPGMYILGGGQNIIQNVTFKTLNPSGTTIYLGSSSSYNEFDNCNFLAGATTTGALVGISLCEGTLFYQCQFQNQTSVGLDATDAKTALQYCHFYSFKEGINAGRYTHPDTSDLDLYHVTLITGSNMDSTSGIFGYSAHWYQSEHIYPLSVHIAYCSFVQTGTGQSYPIKMDSLRPYVNVSLNISTFSQCPCNNKAWLKTPEGSVTPRTITYRNGCTAGN